MRTVFVNLPVTDLGRADAFHGALGLRRDDRISDEKAASYVVEENIVVMLLTRERFAAFVPGQVGDPAAATSVITCLSAGSRDGVDRLVSTAIASGRRSWMPAQDSGPMDGSSSADPDGDVWEVSWMDPAAVQG